jgi:hypothetical protein
MVVVYFEPVAHTLCLTWKLHFKFYTVDQLPQFIEFTGKLL